jgi:hypothetical protein
VEGEDDIVDVTMKDVTAPGGLQQPESVLNDFFGALSTNTYCNTGTQNF